MEEDKEFFDSMNPKLSDFYNLEIVGTEPAQKDLFPIQEELKTLRMKFEGERKVGAGGMKEIFEVKDLPSGRRVAKAKLRDCSNPRDVESFLREARLTASLQHPNVIRIYEIGFDQYPWFSMELIEGQSLEERIKSQSDSKEDWPLFQRLEIFNKICDAMAYAHSKNILHLDIKPDNIQLGPYGEVIVCDWGLGHILFSDEEDIYDEKLDLQNENTMHGYIRGTPGYMAPERIDNKKTFETDIFSLGALLYALLNYSAPFSGKDNTETIENTLTGKISPATWDIPIGIRSVYLKALNTDISDRYTSVKEMQNDVEKFRNGFATQAERASFIKQFLLLCKRNKVICSMAAAFGLIIALIIINYIGDIKSKNKRITAEKQKAELALEMYKNEQEEKQDIAKNFAELLVESTRNKTHGFDIEESLKRLEYALQKDPNNKDAWLVKGYTHFICHQFKDAHYCFEKCGIPRVETAQKISLKYINNSGMLSPAENVKLLREFGDTSDLVLSFIFLYDGETRKSTSDHSQLVKYFLEYRNSAENLKFEYDPKNNSLSLANNVGLFNLNTDFDDTKDYCLLEFLKLKSLDLTNTNFSNLNQLKELELEDLNLANTQVMDLRPLLEMRTLKQVILNRNQSKITQSQNWPFIISYTDDLGNSDFIERAIKQLLTNYEFVDTDKDGSITLKELIKRTSNIGKEELTLFFRKCDVNRDKKLDLKEINDLSVSELKIFMIEEKIKSVLKEKYDLIDRDNNSTLSFEEISKIPKARMVTKFLRKLDKNGDKEISKDELGVK